MFYSTESGKKQCTMDILELIRVGQNNQRAEITVKIPHFSKRDEERIISDTFQVGEHTFCLWIFPQGNPHEPEYAGRALSVYLVLTDLERRETNWVTSAVFSLKVHNALHSEKVLEWHSSLSDNRFGKDLLNWGVHSLGALESLQDAEKGYLAKNDTLIVSANVRIMTVTFRVLVIDDFKRHHGFGLGSSSDGIVFELPFCCTMADLIVKLHDDHNFNMENIRIWCFNQPVASGQSLRPRKLLCLDPSHRPLFGSVLMDGVDIDAYSFCQLFVEDVRVPRMDDLFLAAKLPQSVEGYLFIKFLDPTTQQLHYAGCVTYKDHITMESLYLCCANSIQSNMHRIRLYREEMLPCTAQIPLSRSSLPVTSLLRVSDIVIMEVMEANEEEQHDLLQNVLNGKLAEMYNEAKTLLHRKCGILSLCEIERLCAKMDIPKFRVRSAFRKCKEDVRRTLLYIMEGRHLGFICDSCGVTDFQGPRHNCDNCSDYDLCGKCEIQSSSASHRYANIDGKWQRQFDFTEHNQTHMMSSILPVFYQSENVVNEMETRK